MDAVATEQAQIINHVTDLQQPPSSEIDAEAPSTAVDDRATQDAVATAASATPAASAEEAGTTVAIDTSQTAATGLASATAKRRRYRSLFGNIGKLITFNRRKQEQPASPSAVSEEDHLAESELPFPTTDTVSLDLIVPDSETLSAGTEDPISCPASGFEILEPEILQAPKEATTVESDSHVEDLLEPQAAEAQVATEEKQEEEEIEPVEPQDEVKEKTEEQAAEEKKKMEYDMSLGGISTILEETEEAVQAQEGEILSEADLLKLETEIDLADFSSQNKIQESKVEKTVVAQKNETRDIKNEKADSKDGIEEQDVKASRVVVLQNQLSESDSGYGHSTSDSPVEVEVEKPEKPQKLDTEEVEGSSGGSDVFSKEIEDTLSGKTTSKSDPFMKSDPLISPSDEELASFENAEVCVEDSMVDLVDINVKLDSLIESNSSEKASRSDDTEDKMETVRPEFGRVSESLEEDDDEEMEPVELDLSSNQSVRRRKLMDAKARRQKELEAARKLQEEALSGTAQADDYSEEDAPIVVTHIRDKDIADGLGPRRHSHENNACTAEGSDGGRSRMKSRLPVRRSASCPRRAVEDYSTYIRSGSGGKKPISHLIESSYNPVKIDFRPLSCVAPETHGEQLTKGPQQGTSGDTRPGRAVGQAGKRRGKKVHFHSTTVDQVVTYAAASIDNDEMKQKDSEENGQHNAVKAKQAICGSGNRATRHKAGETEKSATQNDEKCDEEIVQATIIAKSPIYNCAKSWIKVSLDNDTSNSKDRSLMKSISVKQTLASRKRLEKLHEDAVKQLGLQDESQYMTPLQRKDIEVKELKRQLDEAYFVVEQRELELDVFHHEKVKCIDDAVKDRDERIACLQVQISQLESDFSSLRDKHSDMCKREMNLAESLEQLKAECAERERRHQDLYLEMYRKGRDSVKFERQDEIEKLAVLEPDKVAMEELLEKLEITQHDLQKWQAIKLKEVYEDSDKTGTEADAKLKFLRDSMFHYLTEKDREQNQQHLTAMIGIFSFTDVQMKHILKSLDERRRKGKI